MRGNAVRILFSLALFAGMAVGAQAQQDSLLVNVPFDFVAAGRSLPAGRYTISRLAADKPELLVIRGNDGDNTLTTLATLDTQVRGEKLVFHRYGDRYFLSEIWTTSGQRQLPRSKEELRLTRNAEADVATVAGTH